MKQFITTDMIITPVFDEMAEQHLTLMMKGAPIFTVCEPSGPGDQSQFCVWYGDGLDEMDEEAEPIRRFYTKDYGDVKRCFDEAVKLAYRFAILDHMKEG